MRLIFAVQLVSAPLLYIWAFTLIISIQAGRCDMDWELALWKVIEMDILKLSLV